MTNIIQLPLPAKAKRLATLHRTHAQRFQQWSEAAAAAWRTGCAPVRINGIWYVRGAA